MVPTSFVKDGPKLGVLAMNTRPLPKRATLGNRGRETARRAAKRPSTGKLKLSSVTSGYVDVMISLSQVRLSPKKRDFMGVAQKNLIFGLFLGQKWALAAPQELVQQHERHKNVVFLVLTPLHGGPRGGRRGPFLARKSAFFYATPI